MHACNRVLREPLNYAVSPSKSGTSVPHLLKGTAPLRAIEPARVRSRSLHCQAHRSAHRCRGPPSPRRRQRTHTSFPRPPFEHALPRACAGLVRLSLALRSYHARDFPLFSSLPLSDPPAPVPPNARPGDSQVRHKLMRLSPPFPQYHPVVRKTGSCFRLRSLALSLLSRRCYRARRLSGEDLIGYEPRLSACGCGSLCNAPSSGAIRALSYPETSGFPECRAVQVSPRAPAAFLRPRQPSSADGLRCCHAPPAREFHSLSLMPGPNPLARPAVSLSPSTAAASAEGRGGRRNHFRFQRPLRRGEPY